MLGPAINQGWLNTTGGSSVVFDLTVGNGYQVSPQQGGWLELVDDSAVATSGQVTVVEQLAGATLKLVAVPLGNNIWKLTQTSTADATLLYQLTIPHPSSLTGPNPAESIQSSFMDNTLTKPITFNGSIAAVGPSKNNYSQYTLNGTLDSDNVSASGAYVLKFVSSLPAGAPAGSKITDYPLSFTSTNASLTLTDGGVSATITRNVTATAQVSSTPSGPVDQVTAFEINGSISVTGPDATATLTGDMKVTAAYPVNTNTEIPTSIQFSNPVSFTLTSGTATIQGSGNLQLSLAQATINGSHTAIPTSISLQGSYSDSATGVTFNGSTQATLNNFTPGSTRTPATASGSLPIPGQVQQQVGQQT
jgi:hypothetical protein